MACDSLYGAWLKAYYPYEFYSTILKLYTEKGNKDKVSEIITEMKKYANIRLTLGKFGEDNRDWFIDKEHNTISQSLASISFMSSAVAEDLYAAGRLTFLTFTDLLWHLFMNTCLNSRQIRILIGIGYFSAFGKTGKLMSICNEFFDGKMKLSKKLKSWEARLQYHREREAALPDTDLPVIERLQYECDNTGLCFSVDREAVGMYYVVGLDDKYRVELKLYNVARGTESPPLRVNKTTFGNNPVKIGETIQILGNQAEKRPRRLFRDGKSQVVPGVYDWWLKAYKVFHRPQKETKEAA